MKEEMKEFSRTVSRLVFYMVFAGILFMNYATWEMMHITHGAAKEMAEAYYGNIKAFKEMKQSCLVTPEFPKVKPRVPDLQAKNKLEF